MCLILIAWRCHPRYRLVLAANRDEFYARPAKQAHFWPDTPRLLAGRDLQEGGTWSGMTTGGRMATLTNYREPASNRPKAPSRGRLVPGYLLARDAPEEHLRRLLRKHGDLNGFNLLAGDPGGLYWTSNRAQEVRRLEPGVHGLSNRLLNTPWPKVVRGKALLIDLLSSERPTVEDFMSLLADRTMPPEEALPDTGMGLEWERILAPVFVRSPTYGTRSSMVILMDRQGRLTFAERTHDAAVPEEGREVRFSFPLEPE